MTKRAAIVLCFAPLVVFTGCGGSGNRTVAEGVSSVWSGYALKGRYPQVSASWVQPSIDCAATPTGHAVFWVGLDGYFGSKTVEQTGTEAYCVLGTPQYHGWNEAYPRGLATYPDPVKPGDKIFASVTADPDGEFTLVLANRSEGWTQRVQRVMTNAELTSAEVIAEAPLHLDTHHPSPLADFGTVRFTGATANGKLFSALNGLYKIDMSNGTLQASTGRIVNGAFTVTWKH